MGAVASFVEDVFGGVVEAVGDVVDTVGDVVKDVGKAIDDYVVQPILDDPLSAIATIGAATFLGPEAAALFGTSAPVGVGIAAGAANTAAGLVQGEDFDEAIKGGLAAGIGAGVSNSLNLFGEAGGETPPNTTPDPLNRLPSLQNNNIANVDVGNPSVSTNVATPTATLDTSFAPDGSAANIPAANIPAAFPEVTTSTFKAPSLDTSFAPDFTLSAGMKPDIGLQVPQFTPTDYSLAPNGVDYSLAPKGVDYSLAPKGVSGGPGLQLSSAPNLTSMGGGQGLTADMTGLPPYMENGVPTTFTGENGQIYGNATPDVTISPSGATPTPTTITYGNENIGTPSFWDSLKAGNLTDAAKAAGTGVADWYKGASPWEIGAVGLGGAALLGGSKAPPSATPPPKGSTQDKNFTKSLDLYEYMRDRTNYGGDLSKYGQVGQGGEHQFFKNTRFVPVPIPGQNPTPSKMGGLIQMKHYAQGGAAQAMQADPRRAQMMAAMAQQHPAGQGMPQGRPGMPQGPMPQGGMMPGRPRPAPQRPRDPRMAYYQYYQYGNPPPQAKAMGGLSQVNSMRIGGGADGRSDDVPAVLSDGEYVMDAETVAMLGNGSSRAGAKKLDDMRAKLRQHKGKALVGGKISPNAKSPLGYLKGA